MIKRIRRYGRYRDYYALQCFEVRAAVFCTLVISLLFNNLKLYELFQTYQNDLKQIISTVVGGEFSLLGMSLAGMAIITSLFTPEMLNLVNSLDKNNAVGRVLSQFEFFAFNLAVQMVYLVVIYLTISSDEVLISKKYFFTIFIAVIYHFCFNIFYIISLIGNCIEINEIKNLCNKINTIKKSDVDIANEVRIDYILAMLTEERNIEKTTLINDLFKIIDKMNITNPEEIKNYILNYYGK